MAVAVVDPSLHSERTVDGTDHGRRHYRRLTSEIVKVARRRANKGEPVTEIANDLAVDPRSLQLAVNGRTWKQLNAEAPPRPTKVRPGLSLSYSRLVSLARSLADGEKLSTVVKAAGVTRGPLFRALALQFVAEVKARGEST